jgi:ankyrin repeat protein
MVRWLLKHGANINAEDDERRNPLHLLVDRACVGQSPPQLRLVERNELLLLRPRSQELTLNLGPRQGDQLVEVACLLLKHGAHADAKDGTGRTVCKIAMIWRFYNMVKPLPGDNYGIFRIERPAL